ncbi:Uncharacterized protein TCAP_04379, partial [Tolypocladium capitatum]
GPGQEIGQWWPVEARRGPSWPGEADDGTELSANGTATGPKPGLRPLSVWKCLSRHPDTLPTVSEDDEFYAIACEVSTMRFVGHNLPSVVVPEVYAYEGPGSQLATAAGAIYMLLEGFYGNTLRDTAPDLCSLPPGAYHGSMDDGLSAAGDFSISSDGSRHANYHRSHRLGVRLNSPMAGQPLPNAFPTPLAGRKDQECPRQPPTYRTQERVTAKFCSIRTFVELLESPASRIYACFTKLRGSPAEDADQVREMVRLAFGFDTEGADQYLRNIE